MSLSALRKYYPWLVVAYLIVLYTSSFIDRTILGLLVEPIRADLDITDTEFGLIAGFSFALLYTLAGIPMGWVVDHGSRRMLIAGGCAVWSLMTALCGLANSFWQLFAARVGVGVGEATLSPASYSLLSDLFARDKLARALSFYSLGIPLGSGLALLIGGSVVAVVADLQVDMPFVGGLRPWQIVFLLIGIPGLLLAALTPVIIKEPSRHNIAAEGVGVNEKPTIPATISYLWQRRGTYLTIFLGVSAGAAFSYAASTWMPATLIRVHQFSAAEAGIFLGSAMLALGIPGCIFAGWLADHLVARGRADGHLVVGKVYVTGMFVCGALGPLMPWPAVSLTLIAGLGFFSFTWTGVPTALLQIITPNRMRGQTSGIYLFVVNSVGLGLGPTAVGFFTDFTFGDETAVGKSLALVGLIALGLSYISLHFAARRIAASPVMASGIKTAVAAGA